MMCGTRWVVVAVSSGMEQAPAPRRSARESFRCLWLRAPEGRGGWLRVGWSGMMAAGEVR